ncbi:CHAD domain-containing protein [Viridibacterium curvum]|uniref:CYTH and CHAD domain-containing protein n=1 Tax=Viridibacterium curvum TaxID=1101404 RepID=A0ABP9QWE4_9RHOO
MALEIELKLAFPPGTQAQIAAHPLFASAAKVGRASTLENVYFDTPGLLLGDARIALRTRRIGNRTLQTIKCARASSGGLSARPEWEHPFRDAFDFSHVDDDATRALLETHADEITPLFSTVFKRETREYAPRTGVRILMMLDTGSVRAGDKERPIAELELELVEGSGSDLIDLAMQLAIDLPLTPEDTSKAERGYQLFLNTPPTALRAPRNRLTADMTLTQAFHQLASDTLRCWQGNMLGALRHDDPEFIHQLRVALRRLRTLLRVFEAHLPLGFAGHWQLELGHLAASLGGARDMDVLRDAVLSAPGCATGAPDFAALYSQVSVTAAHARTQALGVLAAPPSRLLLLQFLKALHALLDRTTESVDDAEPARLVEFAADNLRRLRKRVAARLTLAASSAATEDLHSLRIACKRLRYASDFFASLFDDKAMRRYQRALSDALDSLGEINDVSVGLERLKDWQVQHPQTTAAIVWVGGWHAAHAEKRSSRALKRVANLLDEVPPWQKSRNAKGAK